MNKLILLTTALLIGATDAANPRFRAVSTLAMTPDKEDKLTAAIIKTKIGLTLKNLMTGKGKTIGGYSESQAKKACDHADMVPGKAVNMNNETMGKIFDKLQNGANSDCSVCNSAHWKNMAPNMYGDDDTFPKCTTKDGFDLVSQTDLDNACQAKTGKKCSKTEATCKKYSGEAILHWEKENQAGLKKMGDYALGVYTTNNYVSMNSCLRSKDTGYDWSTDANSKNWGTPAPWQFVGNVYDQDRSKKGCKGSDDGNAFTCKHIAVMTACAVKGLKELPSFKKNVYRVDDFSADWAKKLVDEIESSKQRSDQAFASTSASDKYFKGHAAGFLKRCATHRSKYTLKASGSNCKHIRKYSAYPEEEEVLCLPNTKFKLTSSKDETFPEGKGDPDCKGKPVKTWEFTEE